MTWDVNVQVPANGRLHRSTVQALRDGDLVFSDKADIEKESERQKVVAKLAELTGDSAAELERLLLTRFADASRRREAQGAQAAPDPDPEEESARRLAETPADVRDEALALLRDPDLIDRVTEDIESQGVAGEKELTATLYLVYTSRKLSQPLAARVRGPSTSGKSHVIDRTAALMPPEAVIRATQVTPQALFYMPRGSLRHKLIVAGERSRNEDDEAADATRALREMISAGRLSKMLPMRSGDGIETVLVEQEGPIAFVESTTLGEVFAEDENRALPLYTDERPEQTRRILQALAAGKAGLDKGGRDPERVRLVHHAAQRLLARREVVIPFAPAVAAKLSESRVETRRAFPALLSMVSASSLLHQYQREETEDGRVLATREDYRIASALLSGPLRRQLGGGLPEPARRFLGRVRGWFGDSEFTVRQAKAREETSRASVYTWVGDLRAAGFAEQVEAQSGNRAARYRLVPEDACPADRGVLPRPEDVFGRV